MSKFLLNLLLQIFQALVNSKSNFYSKEIIPPNSAHSAQPACPLPRPRPADRPNSPRPKPPAHSAQPASPCMRWRICKGTSSSLIHAFRHRRLLSLPSLTRGPHMSDSSSPPRRPTPAAPPLPAPPAPRLGIPLSHYRPAPITPPLNPPSNRALIEP